MSKIRFDDIMKFYPHHNFSVYCRIVAAQKKESLIPFVGAGMSVFCDYMLWGNVLRKLAEFIQEDTEDQYKTALEQIKNGAYEEAAQTILEAYPPMFDQLQALISPDKLENCPQEKFRASAAFVLPYLFQKGLVITTNFDRVLENVYQSWRNKPIQTVTPNQQDRLAQFRQNCSLGLFKLHGDIGSDTVSIDDLVFTGEQYKEKYADDSPLVQELTRWFENHRLLFLGCSLNMDRTMKVLKSVTLDQPSIRHYAIVGCKKSDIPKRLKELSDLGILPVFYNDNNHDAVRVILERLLEDTDQCSYKKLWKVSQVLPAAKKEERRLLFDSDYFPFTGRDQELELLEAFCDSEEKKSWWAVTGPGGMGKSRLVYEFAKLKHKDGWQIERFEARPSKDSNANLIEALNSWVPEVSQTIVVLDDVQAHMDLVRRWLNEVVRCPRSEKLRILLLEREGTDLNSSSWLGAESGDDIPDEWCYDKKFLYLEPMDSADLIKIMDDYAAAAGKQLNAELLLKTLERVDPQLKRPLYAVAIADARCQGKDPTRWDRKKVLDTLLDRELNFHFNRFQGMTGEKATKTLRAEMKELLARSCVRGVLFLDDAEMKHYPKLVKKMNDVDMDCQEFMEGLGILRIGLLRSIIIDQSGNPIGEPLEEWRKVIALSCPDLIQEHLVLNLAFEGGKRELLFPQGWHQNIRQLLFLRQLLVDYSDRLKEQPDYWKTIFQAAPQDILSASVYGNILWGYTAYYSDDARAAVDRLVQLYDEMKHAPEIAAVYAKGLVNLSAVQNLKDRTASIAHLDALYQNHPDIPEVVVAYANGLVNLSVVQNLKDRTETVARLDELYQNYPDISEVEVMYANGLFSLAYAQDLKESTKTVARLDKLYRNHPNIPEVAVKYASGLANLAVDQNLKGCTATVAQLDALYQNHLDIPEVVVAYAKGLASLTAEQDLKDRTKTAARLDELYRNHPDIPRIAVEYATGLFNLIAVQTLEDRTATIARLHELYQDHPDLPEVVTMYAEGLLNLTVGQDLKGCKATVARLDKLYQNRPDIPEVAAAYAKGLVNLTVAQDVKERTATVSQLDKLHQSHPNILEIVGQLAGGLANLTIDQDLKNRTVTVARLDEIYHNYPDLPEVAAIYANGLLNLTVDQELKDRTATVARLDELYQNHPDTPKVAAAYAKGLCNLTVVQGSKDCTATVARLDTLYQSHPDSEDIVSAFVVCLLNVALHQKSESEIRNILARSSAVLDRYPKNSSIQLFHAMIWFVLTLRQHEIDISATAADIANFLHSNTGIIPKFKEALDKYLSAHPDYAVWYQPLLYL